MSELSVNFTDFVRRSMAEQPSTLDEESASHVALMSQVKRGDETALRQLLQSHGNDLYRLVGRLTGWHADTDDVFQEVLITVWRKAGDYRAQGSLEGWLRQIAVNRVKNHFRALGRLRKLVDRVAERLGGDANLTSNLEIEREPDEQLELALQSLSHSDRMAVALFYLEELPGEEVAQILGIRLDSLHVKLHRARKRLKNILEFTEEPEHGK